MLKYTVVTKGILVISAIFVFYSLIYGEISGKKFGIGINFPGIGLRYFLSDKISLELKGQYEPDILVAGVRGYRYFNTKERLLLFSGLEMDAIFFKDTVSEGNGLAIEIFVGGEYFFAKKFSFQFDFGPALIGLFDRNTRLSVGGIEFIINLGTNYYFGR